MTSYVSHTSVDCRDAYALSEFWKGVLGYEDIPGDPNLGATQLEDRRDQHGPGTGWVVLADPEGNEFCVLRSEAERAAAAS